MNGIEDVIRQLENQKAAIERALAALREVDGTPAASVDTPAVKHAVTNRRSEGQKKRWAAKQTAPVSKPVARKGGMTPEGRQKLADAMKRRWAVKRAAAKKRGPKKVK